ncbi:MAG: omptin family outer membrane protease [Kiritimatiellae bacterium]|nr:omptin family outer membrane protease [Kiritimatiellia bacterium]
MTQRKLKASLAAGMMAATVAAEAIGVDAGVGAAHREGAMRYEIGRRVWFEGGGELLPFPISRLEFPIRALVAEGWLRVHAGDHWEGWVRAGHTLTDDAGTVKDSDWEYPSGQQMLAVYSESDARYEGWTIEGGVRWWPLRRVRPGEQEWALGVGAGWARHSHSWEARDGVQVYPATPDVPPDTWSGVAIEYDVEADLPYAELALRLRQLKVGLEIRGYVSPLARLRDRDDHVLRAVVAEMDAEGIALGAEALLRYEVSKRWYLTASLRWWALSADGYSKNRVYATTEEMTAGEQWTIEEELRGEEMSLGFGAGFTW